MNIENLKKVRDLIASRPAEAVHMTSWGQGSMLQAAQGNWCGTAGCIGGWAAVLRAIELGGGKLQRVDWDGFDDDSGDYIKGWNGWMQAGDAAQTYLGLSDSERYKLFNMGSDTGQDRIPYTLDFFNIAQNRGLLGPEDQKRAVLAVLDKAIETGTIDWPGVVYEMFPDAITKLQR